MRILRTRSPLSSSQCHGQRGDPRFDRRWSATSLWQATWTRASRVRKASRIASEMRSQILSRWPAETDSDVSKPWRVDTAGPLFSGSGEAPGAASWIQVPPTRTVGRPLLQQATPVALAPGPVKRRAVRERATKNPPAGAPKRVRLRRRFSCICNAPASWNSNRRNWNCTPRYRAFPSP